jgi:DNA-binding beta-propeller fold protein YncE
MKNQIILLALLALTIQACTDEPPIPTPIDPNLAFDKGVFIINEGNFGVGNASIDFYQRDSNRLIKNVFETVNGRPLGDVAQAMTIFKNKGYIVLNGSAKVEVIDAKTFKSEASINGFSSPRCFVGVDENRGFVADWISNTVKEINIQTNTIVASIAVGEGPEALFLVDSFLYVANSGGYINDSTVSIINIKTNQIVKQIVVGDAPIAFALDANKELWVLCRGDYKDYSIKEDDTKGALVKINTSTQSIISKISIGEQGDHPDKLAISNDKQNVFINTGINGANNGIYKIGINENALPMNPFVAGYFYGIGIDPLDDKVYAADPLDFSQDGIMWRYNSSTGTLIDSIRVGKVPNGIHLQ